MTQIKVSGIVLAEDAALAAELGVDIVACVFNSKSPRYVTLQQAWAIRRAFDQGGRIAGVFVSTPVPVIQRMADSVQLELIQLYGDEPRADLDALGPTAFPTLRFGDIGGIEPALRQLFGRRPRRHDGPAVALHLTDAAGNAWDGLEAVTARHAVVLSAAGLNADTAAQAVRTARPWAVDVWDAVESAPGRLDRARLADFIAAVRSVAPVSRPQPPGEEPP